MLTRKDVEEMKVTDRPKVRCKFDCELENQDGQRTPAVRETIGRIIIDGNNPWIEISAAGKRYAERFSWGLVLDVINDPHATPIWFSEKGIVYEI